MARIRLITWDLESIQMRVATLRRSGHTVNVKAIDPDELRKIKNRPPQCFIVDLGRRPSVGRDLALEFRRAKATRNVPIVLVEGDQVTVEKTKNLLPDATYTSWSRIKSSIRRALAHAPSNPVTPGSSMAGYSGTPLPRKLGIKSGHTVHLVGAPSDFPGTLGPLADDIQLKRSSRGQPDLVLWFVKSLAKLQDGMAARKRHARCGALWIIWPKQKGGMTTDVTQKDVRAIGIDSGMVDYKICAVDETWSGLKFAHRS